MADKDLLDRYRALVPFLVELCGPHCEVLLHDVRRPGASVVAVANSGPHSDRHVGSPLTEYAQEMIRDRVYEDRDYLSNYGGASKGKDYLCSTFFIKDGQELIGMLCINRDMSALLGAEQALALVKLQFNLRSPAWEVQEVLDDEPVATLLSSMIDQAVLEAGASCDRLKKAERAAVVRRLHGQGALRMKGAVGQIARRLGISEPTVYRYLREGGADGPEP